MAADLQAPTGGYQWRVALQGPQPLHLMASEGAHRGILLASGTAVATAGTFLAGGGGGGGGPPALAVVWLSGRAGICKRSPGGA